MDSNPEQQIVDTKKNGKKQDGGAVPEDNGAKAIVRTELDLELFKRTMEVTCVKVPNNKIREVQKQLAEYMIILPRFKPCKPIEGDNQRKMLTFKRIDANNEKLKAAMKLAEGIEITESVIETDYENLNMVEALKILIFSLQKKNQDTDTPLPKLTDKDIPSGFETVGDVAHMNLNQLQYPFRFQIGQVVLDKNANIRSVVCKVGLIQSEYRYYDLECIAGESGPGAYETIQVEDKVRFKVDVSKVYWCSKLATERNRMIQAFLKDGEVLCDMMCGIGPLAVKAAVKRKGLKVVCNDLNPEGIKYCKENIRLNKVGDRVTAFNMDGREFVKFHVAQSNVQGDTEIPKDRLRFHHCYMNLPMIAVEFLNVFNGLFKDANPDVWFADPSDPKTLHLPMIHVYGFSQFKEHEAAKAYFAERIGKAMGMPFGAFKPSDIEFFHDIRDVSGTSHMFSSSFRLPYEVAMGLVGPAPPNIVFSEDKKEQDEEDEKEQKAAQDGDTVENENLKRQKKE